MKPITLLTALLLAACSLAAQTAATQDQKSARPGAPAPTPTTVIRGCLSGSPGNFTVTDQNGTQYKVMGTDKQLQGKVGHEVEISGMEGQAADAAASGSSASDDAASHPGNSLQASDVREVSSTCKKSGGPAGTSPLTEGSGPK